MTKMSDCVCAKEGYVKYLKTQLELARREINNLRKQVKTLNFVHRNGCDDIKEKLKNWKCVGCNNTKIIQSTDIEKNVTTASTESTGVLIKHIGIISTKFPEKRGTPRQPAICPNAVAKLSLTYNVFTNPHHALQGLQEFSHMWILFHFHKNSSTHVMAKVSPPRLNGCRTGVFATRSPHRPNPIGLSLVKIHKIVENNIYFYGVDMIDKTPVFDIKPYIPRYDNPSAMNWSESLETKTRKEETFMQQLDKSNIHVTQIAKNSSRVSEPFFTERLCSEVKDELPDTSNVATSSEGHTIGASKSDVRIPLWIDHSAVKTLTVVFAEQALSQISQLENENEERKKIIVNVLREDPRSVYVRERKPNNCYTFRIENFNVSCKFNDMTHTVTVLQVFR
jgi:tRNA-Thr(GGU) m(6)t(6)A37 methyltransferase TsaA